MKYTEARKVEQPTFLWINEVQCHHCIEDDLIAFTTKGGTRVQGGRVLEVDLLAQLPIRVEYQGPEGKRIERFHPDEFKTFNKENRQ